MLSRWMNYLHRLGIVLLFVPMFCFPQILSKPGGYNTSTVFGSQSLTGKFTTPIYPIWIYPSWSTGTFYFKISNLTGAPNTCTMQATWYTQNGEMNSQSLIIPVTLSGLSSLQVIGSASITPVAVNLNYNCLTYPTGGVISIEYMPTLFGQRWSYSHITTNTNTVVTNASTIHSIVVGKSGTTETLTIYDNGGNCTGTETAVIVPVNGGTYILDTALSGIGFCIVSAGTTAGDYTVTWK